MNTQYRKNLKAVAQACKDYTDNKIKKVYFDIGHNDITTDDHTNELAYQITAPANAKLLMLQSIGGNTVKLSPSVASDSTKAMIKTMPSTVYTFDGSKFYGDSEVSENKYTANPQPMITLSGGGERWISLGNIPIVNGKTYTIKFFNTGVANEVVQLENYGYTTITYSQPYTFTANTDFVRIRIGNGDLSGDINYQLKLMIVEGSTAPTTFVQGYDDIHNIELSGLKVEGSNKFNNVIIESGKYPKNDGTYENNSSWNCYEFKAKPSTSYTISGIVNSSVNSYFNAYNGDTFISAIGTFENGTYTTPANTTKVIYGVRNNEINNIMINEGSTALPYEPHISTTKTIDLTTILYNGNPLFEGNSLKAVGTAKDYITPYVAHKEVGAIQIKNIETINYNSEYQVFYFYIITKQQGDVIMANFTTVNTTYQQMNNMEISGASSANGINVKDTSCADVNAFRTKYGDYWLLFQLATPIEVSIDWSATLRNIQGYSNGTITLENTYNMDVESVITYNSIIQETLCPSITITRNGVEVETRNLPTQASDGYGINADAHNLRVFSDYEGNAVNKRYTNISKELIGTLTGGYDSSRPRFYLYTINFKPNNVITMTSSRYTANAGVFDNPATTDLLMGTGADGTTFTTDFAYSDFTTYKNANANVALYGELKDTSKTESDMEDFDYFFDVEEGDVITFNNPYAQQVYATYSFLIKEAKSNE